MAVRGLTRYVVRGRGHTHSPDYGGRLLTSLEGQYARREGATLIIAKLDRLARSVAFIFALRDSGVKFLACDMPEANTLTIGLLAALAQHERELISERTKAALRAKKARGCVLGSPQNLTREATLKAAEARRRRALEDPANRRATELASLYRNCGLSYKAIAGKLNSNGHTTRRGKTFSACTIQRLLGRAEEYGLQYYD